VSPDFGKMMGPLPLGAWVAVVGGGLAYAVYSRRQADIAPASASTDPNVDTSGGVGTGGDSGWVQTGGGTDGPVQSVGSEGGFTPTTNVQWGNQAINWLIRQNYDAATANRAINKFLRNEGGRLSPHEFTLVNLALAEFGPPPRPTLGPFPAPTPRPPHPPRPTPHPGPHPGTGPRHYVVRNGDTLRSLSNHFYHNPAEFMRIVRANHLGTRRKLHAGEQLLIPR
jgi:nucleoid-associated protein YgaU